MTSYIHGRRVYRDSEYAFSSEENRAYPHLARLLLQGYNFVILRRRQAELATYVLACEVICSNGTELLHRHETLTPDFGELAELENFIGNNMMNVLHRHFFGRDMEPVR
ncbi:MAG: hypothetical protein NVV73_16100 [Cellvibrionaceae bacterium]|nr:hypothetical protein [Cellvibrionaceae bacterium]